LTVADNANATSFKIVGPNDPDGDELSVEITGVPKKGSVTSGNKRLEKGSVVTVDQLAAATYEPERGGVGKVGSFSFLVRDNRGAIVTANIPVTVQQSNRPPESPKEVALQIGRIPLGLREPVDPDGDSLKVTITKVPREGSILLGYQPLVLGDEVAASDLPLLVFHPGSTFTGDAGTFEISIEDSGGAVATTSVRIALPGVSKKEPVATVQEAKVEEPEPASAAVEPEPAPVPVLEVQESEPQTAAVPPELEEPSPEIVPQGGEYKLLTTSNLRAGPNSSFDRIATLDRGTLVAMTGRVVDSDWFKIRTDAGVSGYIYGDLIEKVEGEQVAARSLTDEEPEAQSESSIQVAVGIFEEGSAFKDCDFCPSLVRVPPGSFVMGSKSGHSSERPQHKVDIARAFAIGVYEVTMAEWNACVLDGGCHFRPELEQDASGSLPVFNVSWEDVQEYLVWLSSETGKEYRLPSGATTCGVWLSSIRNGTYRDGFLGTALRLR